MYKISEICYAYPQNPKNYKNGLLNIESVTIVGSDNDNDMLSLVFIFETDSLEPKIEVINKTKRPSLDDSIDLKSLKKC